jgi:hypothetical protein
MQERTITKSPQNMYPTFACPPLFDPPMEDSPALATSWIGAAANSTTWDESPIAVQFASSGMSTAGEYVTFCSPAGKILRNKKKDT